jgi:hypothetical protein
MSEILRLQANKPQVIALTFTEGRPVTSPKTRKEQIMFSLTDGSIIFLDPAVARKIDALNLGKGEPFEITKRSGENYDVRYFPAEGQSQPAPQSPSQRRLESPLSGTPTEVGPLHQQHSAPCGQSPLQPDARKPSPHTTGGKLMACFLVAVDSLLEVQAYATAKGMNIQFNSEDVRAVANTMFIQNSKDGR